MDKYTENGSINLELVIDGIDTRDYPDFCDAFISSANWVTGEELTDEELEQLNEENRQLVHEMAFESIF